jgi:hypothetical protein
VSGAPDTVFRFESPGMSVEFAGPEAFVEAQLERLLERIRKELAAALARGDGASAPESGDAAESPSAAGSRTERTRPAAAMTAAAAPTLADFHSRAHSREGRGALQETILIFAYYLSEIRGQPQVSIDDLTACFAETGATPPSNLANTLGIMKRSQGFFDAGAGRGRYVLTTKGAAYVRRLIGAQ